MVTILSTCPKQNIDKQAIKKDILPSRWSSDISVYALTIGNNCTKLMAAITLRLFNE